jgi:hypothetical protein
MMIDEYLVEITGLNGFRIGIPEWLATMRASWIDKYPIRITILNGFQMGMPEWSVTTRINWGLIGI